MTSVVMVSTSRRTNATRTISALTSSFCNSSTQRATSSSRRKRCGVITIMNRPNVVVTPLAIRIPEITIISAPHLWYKTKLIESWPQLLACLWIQGFEVLELWQIAIVFCSMISVQKTFRTNLPSLFFDFDFDRFRFRYRFWFRLLFRFRVLIADCWMLIVDCWLLIIHCCVLIAIAGCW